MPDTGRPPAQVDEKRHRTELVFDDAVRMLDIEREWEARGAVQCPKLWIRYNPNSFKLGDIRRNPPRELREKWLKDVLSSVSAEQTDGLVLYAFYPASGSRATLPAVAFDPNYPNELAERARCHVNPLVPLTCMLPQLAATELPSDEDESEEESDGETDGESGGESD